MRHPAMMNTSVSLYHLREKVMRRFKSPGHAQRFLSAVGIINSHFRVGRHLFSAGGYRAVRQLRFADWKLAIGVCPAA